MPGQTALLSCIGSMATPRDTKHLSVTGYEPFSSYCQLDVGIMFLQTPIQQTVPLVDLCKTLIFIFSLVGWSKVVTDGATTVVSTAVFPLN